MAGRFSVEAIFKAVDRVTAPVSRMQNRVGKFTRSMSRGLHKLNRNVDKFIGGMKRAGIAVVASMAIAGGAMANVIGTGAEFEQTMVSAAAKYPGEIRKGSEAFALLEGAARKAGATTEFTASQAAEGLNFLAMAGFNAEQSVAALPGVIDLATASGVELATASDIATDSLGAFGLATKDATQLGLNLARVNDVLTRTTTSANTTMEDLFETVKKGGATATASGMQIEEFAAMAGIMANSGLKASEAGSVMKNMILKLSAPTPAATKLLKRFNIATQDSEGNLLNMTDILGDMSNKLQDLGTAQKGAVLDTIFGKRAIVGVQVLMQEGSEAIKNYTEQLKGATGASSTMADVMRDTLLGRLKTLNSAVESVKITMFTMTSGPLSEVVDRMTAWVRANEQLIATNLGNFLLHILNNIDGIVEAFGGIAKGIAAFIALSIALKGIVAILSVINLIMMANPLVLGIMAAVAAVALLSGALDPVVEFIKDIGEGIASAFRGVKQITGMFGDDEEDEAGGNQQTGATGPQIVSPQERVARSIEELRQTNNSEITLKTEPGTSAEVTSGGLGPLLSLQNSGAF